MTIQELGIAAVLIVPTLTVAASWGDRRRQQKEDRRVSDERHEEERAVAKQRHIENQAILKDIQIEARITNGRVTRLEANIENLEHEVERLRNKG